MMNHASQLGGCRGKGSEPTHDLQGIIHLDALVQLIVEHIRQAERITLVRFEQSLLALLDMEHIGRDIQFLQVLKQRPMIVPGHFHNRIHLSERHIPFDPVKERTEPFPRVVKGQRWTHFKSLMTGQQGGGDKAGDVAQLSNIDPHVHGLVGQHRQGLERWTSGRLTRHADFCLSSLPAWCVLDRQSNGGVEKPGSVGAPLPTSDQKSDLQTRVRSTNTPLSFLSRVKLQRKERVLRNLYQRGATPLDFSINNSTLSRRKNQASYIVSI